VAAVAGQAGVHPHRTQRSADIALAQALRKLVQRGGGGARLAQRPPRSSSAVAAPRASAAAAASQSTTVGALGHHSGAAASSTSTTSASAHAAAQRRCGAASARSCRARAPLRVRRAGDASLSGITPSLSTPAAARTCQG